MDDPGTYGFLVGTTAFSNHAVIMCSSLVYYLLQVTSLCLDNQHIAKLSGLDKLANLKWASFCHNDIVKMEVTL